MHYRSQLIKASQVLKLFARYNARRHRFVWGEDATSGGWVYFSFGHKSPPYEKMAKAFPTDAYNACHEASAETDYVFTQF